MGALHPAGGHPRTQYWAMKRTAIMPAMKTSQQKNLKTPSNMSFTHNPE